MTSLTAPAAAIGALWAELRAQPLRQPPWQALARAYGPLGLEPQAAYAAGIARQIDRPDLPPATRARLIAAEAILWQGIEASDALRTSEFWTYMIDDEGSCIPVPAQGAGIVNESNPVQLWSTVYLAIHPPAR